MSASATKCRPPPAQRAVDRGDHRLARSRLCRAVIRRVGVPRVPARLLSQRPRVAGQLDHVESRSGRPRPLPVLTITRTAGSASSSAQAIGQLLEHRGVDRRCRRPAGRTPASPPARPCVTSRRAVAAAHRPVYRPPKSGGRFSFRTPRALPGSPRSASRAPWRSASLRSCCSSDGLRGRRGAATWSGPSATVGPAASGSTSASAASVEVGGRYGVGGPSPTSAASVPETTRPSSSISRARTSPTRRGSSQVAAAVGREPRSANGSHSRASSATTVDVGRQRDLQADPGRPSAGRADHRHLDREQQRDQSVGLGRAAAAGCSRPAAGRVRPCVAAHDVEAAAEVVAGAGEDDGPHRLVLAGHVERRR